jgi:hypothetical protein
MKTTSIVLAVMLIGGNAAAQKSLKIEPRAATLAVGCQGS